MRCCWTCLLSVSMAGALGAAEPIDAARFDRVREIIKPQVSEQKWAEIRWGVDLWEARRQAAAQGKPILLWEMDGHPLGCT